MTSLASSKGDAASFRMIVASIILHGSLIGLAVIASSWLWDYKKPQEEKKVIQVTMVEPAVGPLVPQVIKPGPEQSTEPQLVQDVPPEEPAAAEVPRDVVQPKVVDRPTPAAPVPLAKRRREPLKVESPKEPAKKPEPETKSAKKKEDPDKYLKDRMAALRTNAEKKKASSPANDVRPSGAGGTKPDGAQTDREWSMWSEMVKSRIRSHWVVIGDNTVPDKVTTIGVQIADNGRLVGASVDVSSGDQIFDRHAMRAIYQAAPFPSVPSEVKEKIQQAGGLALTFTPKGIR